MMPHSELHRKKLWKNMALGAALFGFIALFWIITMIKIAANSGG